MLIQCTQKLLTQLKIKPEPLQKNEETELFSWHANLLTIDRRKAVVLVNDSTRYVVVLYGLVAKDFKKIDSLITEAIRHVFQAEGISEDIIEQYLDHSPTFTFTKTKDRTSVARMNKSVEAAYFFSDLIDKNAIIQRRLSLKASRYLVGRGDKEYIQGNEELFKALSEFAGKSIFQKTAIKLKVTLDLEEFNVWREVIVPLDMTFSELHHVLQVCFSWQNYHLHEFHVNQANEPIMNIVSTEEAFDFPSNIPMKIDTEVKLSEYIPKYKSMTYYYDFGDGWQHDITIDEIVFQYDKNHPILLDGGGETPPEDVGGEHGYKHFLEVINDKEHPDYYDMTKWGRMQRYKAYNPSWINMDLKDILVEI